MAYTPTVSYELYGPKNAPSDSTAKDYMSHNLDVWNAFNADPSATDANAFATQHYNNFGKNESRAWGTPTAPTPSNSLPAQNVTLPGMSNTNAPGWINSLGQSIPNYFDAYNSSKDLPNMIDNWMKNSINRQRMTGDQVKGIFNQVGNQRAGSGIMGGTEYDNSVAALTSNLAKIFEENQGNIEMTGNQLKANSISGLPTQAMAGINALTSLYGTNASDQQNWAQLAAQMINTGY